MNLSALLKSRCGFDSFRPGQEKAVRAVLDGHDVICVLPTGGGKSVCYQIPAMLLPGVTLVVSPLISLMKDQVTALTEKGVPAAFLSSVLTPGDTSDTLDNIRRGAYKLLYVAPERLTLPAFREALSAVSVSLVAVDEAHCVSQWGHDFRPSYLQISPFVSSLSTRPVVGAFTATATPQVAADITNQLGLCAPVSVRTGFDRPNLRIGVDRPGDKTGALIAYLKKHIGASGIIYCMTRRHTDELCAELNRRGFPAARYHAGMSSEERLRSQTGFLDGASPIMVATNAFGMGIDKPDIAFVIHYDLPLSLEGYWQEAGRAGRDGRQADCILYFDSADISSALRLIDHGGQNEAVPPSEARTIRERKHERLRAMVAYARTANCLRGEILRYFGDIPAKNCGNCSNCIKTLPLGDGSTKPDPKLRHKLMYLRMRIAVENHIDSPKVFSDGVIDELCVRRPRSAAGLREIQGLCEDDIVRYGDSILAVIRAFV